MNIADKRAVFVVLLFFVSSLVIPGCQFEWLRGYADEGFELVQSAKERDLSPETTSQELEGLVRGNSSFAVDLYREIKGKTGNQFFSPLSISLALAMTYGGARGETALEMAEALHFDMGGDQLHAAFNALDLDLASRGEDTEEGFELSIANFTWGQRDYEFLDSYLDLLAINYGAGMRLLDFVREPEPSRQIINQWVSERTNERIKDLLPEGSISPLTVLVLTNAIYFNAKWLKPFPPERTYDGSFRLLDGSQVTVPMMGETLNTPFLESDGVIALELPYLGEETSMVILMPDVAQFSAFEDSLSYERLNTLISGLQDTEMSLRMPKFSFAADYDVIPILRTLGMEKAFVGGVADFSGMDGTRDLFISGVVHKAFVAVDEEGTEAAAATGVVVGRTSLPPREVVIDHPFIFMIRDRVTGTILFMGRVVDPS